MLHIDIKHKNKSLCISINEQISVGNCVGIFGKSGCGKSSLLHLISGLIEPQQAEISFEGKIWHNASTNLPSHRRPLAYIQQHELLFAHMSVKQNLKYALRSIEDNILLEELIEIIEIETLLPKMPKVLSGGERQKVLLVRSLLQKPKVWLLDEPLSAIDFEMRKYLQRYILKTQQQYKLTSIIVSHDPYELQKLCNEIWIMDKGNVIQKGDFEETLEHLIH